MPKRVVPSVALRRWREASSLNRTEAAKLLGVQLSIYCLWEGRKRRPNLMNIFTIHVRTKGAVPWTAWVKKDDRKLIRAATKIARKATPAAVPSADPVKPEAPSA